MEADHDAEPVAQPDPRRHAAYGPHFILALRRPAVASRLARTLVVMDTVQTHAHSFAPDEWPFSDPVNVVAISTRQVFHDGFEIRRVSHDYDGDWQILCGTTNDVKDALVVCLGCAYQRDRSIGELALMPRGWTAWREHAGAAWELEQKEREEDDD